MREIFKKIETNSEADENIYENPFIKKPNKNLLYLLVIFFFVLVANSVIVFYAMDLNKQTKDVLNRMDVKKAINNIYLLKNKKFNLEPKEVVINPKDYGENCVFLGECKNLAAINCQAEIDGPLYYINKTSGEIVECCGGCCENKTDSQYCQECPPREWDCN